MIGVFLYPIMIPVGTLSLLFKNRNGIKTGAGDVYDRYEFLVGDYKPVYYHWDCVEMLRKVALTGLVSFVSRGSVSQLVVAIVISIASLTASAWCQPYADPRANVFKAATEVSILITLVMCVLLKVDLEKEKIFIIPMKKHQILKLTKNLSNSGRS